MLRFLLVNVLLLLLNHQTLAQPQLATYRVWFGLTTQSPRQVVLRRWQQGGLNMYLTVDPQTLETAVVSLPDKQVIPLSWPALEQEMTQTPYLRAVRTEKARDQRLQDAGIDRSDTTESGFSLTIDLCPSGKPLVRSVFRQLIRSFETAEKPIPVTIAITGLWMEKHGADLAYLKNLVNRGDLRITWVNHSYHHRYDPVLPLAKNFLLESGTDLRQEVLLNEQAMLLQELTPSVFFRFPGLVSDKAVFDQVLGLGLLSIGSDAWLAKNQQPRRGSLVLIHGNGNEPVGIADFMRLIREHDPAIRAKTWLLFELPQSIANTERH